MAVSLSKSSEVLLFVLLPVVIWLASAALIVKSAWVQDHLLDRLSEEPSPAKEVYRQLVFPSNWAPSPLLTADENSHMADVRGVITLLEFLLFGLVVVSILSSWQVISASGLPRLGRVSFISGIAALVIPIIIALLPFDFVFTAFHKVFFPQGNWEFPEGSVLISYFPYNYFMWNAVAIGVVAFALALACAVTGRSFSRRGKL